MESDNHDIKENLQRYIEKSIPAFEKISIINKDSKHNETTTSRTNIPPDIELHIMFPSLISLNGATNCKDALQHINLLLEHLPTVSIEDVDEKVLKHVMPVIKRCLHKVFVDNILLFDSIDDEIVFVIIKENIRLCLGFIAAMKVILFYFLENENVEFSCICGHISDFPECLFIIFEHYRKCEHLYENKFQSELLDILKLSEELHLLFLRLLDSSLTISTTTCQIETTHTLIEVLDTICNTADVLWYIRPELTVETWKNYTTVVRKFHGLLGGIVNLRLPIQCLTSVIHKNLIAVTEEDKSDGKPVVIKLLSFFTRILLRLCTTFANCLKNVSNDLLGFLCMIYRYPLLITNQPDEIISIMDKDIFRHVDIFLVGLLQDKELLQILFQEMQCGNRLHDCPAGGLNLIATLLKLLPQSQECDREFAGSLLKLSFFLVDSCDEFFLSSNFYALVVYITVVIKELEIYDSVEGMFQTNILQRNPYKAVLAVEIWTLYLQRSHVDFVNKVVDKWLVLLEQLHFGTFSSKVEQSYVGVFSQKLFRLLSNEKKIEISNKYPPEKNLNIWKFIKFKDYPREQIQLLDNLIGNTSTRIRSMEKVTSFKDLKILCDNLDVLATLDIHGSDSNNSNLLNAVSASWNMDLGANILKNNVLKYFLMSSAKLLRSFGNSLTASQLNMMLQKLQVLSKTHDIIYYFLLLELLPLFRSKNQDALDRNPSILQIFQNVSTYLLNSQSVVASQQTFQILRHFSGTSYEEGLINIVTGSLPKENENALYNFLHGGNENQLVFKLFQEMKSSKHKCVEWSLGDYQPLSKKIKLDDNAADNSMSNFNKKEHHQRSKKISKPGIRLIRESKENFETIEEDTTAHEVIDRIKGEVKCLAKITKTEKLTLKNCTDLKIIANQLLSIM